LNYQLNIGKKAFEIVSHSNGSNSMQEVLNIKKQQERFLEIMDSLFHDTDKKIDRTNNEIAFISGEKTLTPYQLSSGEKQILVILLTVLIHNNKPSILFMDEPEISLHIDWQKKLIQYIKELNPNVQIILATHSPAVVMEGWLDKVFEISDLITLDRKAK
jgi:predicted ATP-dependent endonuclease of OLD family